MKQCTKCKKLKSKSEFYKNRTCKDGLSLWCKKCSRKYSQERYRKGHKTVRSYHIYEESHRVVNNVKEKCCSGCKKWKAESMFYKHRTRKDGLADSCKECANKATNKARKKRLATYRHPIQDK